MATGDNQGGIYQYAHILYKLSTQGIVCKPNYHRRERTHSTIRTADINIFHPTSSYQSSPTHPPPPVTIPYALQLLMGNANCSQFFVVIVTVSVGEVDDQPQLQLLGRNHLHQRLDTKAVCSIRHFIVIAGT